MSRSLERLFRLRSLLEGVAQAELERCAREADRVESAIGRQQTAARQERRKVFELLTGDEERHRERCLAESAAEMALWRAQQLRPLAAAAARRAETARRSYLDLRKERKQIETLLAARRQEEELERRRKEQRQLDDRFGVRAARRPRNPPES